MASVFTMAGVTNEGYKEVDYLRLLTSLMYSSRLMGEDFSGRATVIDLRCWRSFLVCILVEETSTSFPRILLSPHSIIPFYDII